MRGEGREGGPGEGALPKEGQLCIMITGGWWVGGKELIIRVTQSTLAGAGTELGIFKCSISLHLFNSSLSPPPQKGGNKLELSCVKAQFK